MNILFEKFPEAVEVDGKSYSVETDFREWIRFTELVEDEKVPWQMKCHLLLQWYTEEIPENIEGAINALGEFLTASLAEDNAYENVDNSSRKQDYSFSQDAECIYSAFREVYGIDLQSVEYMHWWEFRTLFAGLPETTEIKQRIIYRNVDLREVKDKDERKRIKRIQSVIALKKKNQRKIDDFEIGAAFS